MQGDCRPGCISQRTCCGPQVLFGPWMHRVSCLGGLRVSKLTLVPQRPGRSFLGPLLPSKHDSDVLRVQELQPAGFPTVLSCLFMFDFIGCHSFYINWLYDFHGFLSLPALLERSFAVTGRATSTSAPLSWSQTNCKFINQLLKQLLLPG